MDEGSFRARFPWVGGDLQTVRNQLISPRIVLDSAGTERWEVALDDGSRDRLVLLEDRPRSPREGSPTVVLVHGLTGCDSSFYIQESARHFLALGCPVVRVNLRGAGPSRPLCQGMYHAGRTADFEAVVGALTARGHDRLVVVAYSLGGNMVLKYLGERPDQRAIAAAISISAPIHLAETAERFVQPRNSIYHRWLLTRMREETLAARDGQPEAIVRAVETSRTVIEFDDRVVAALNGFQGASDYYARNMALPYLPEIRVPTLLIHALNDPWIPARAYLTFDWEQNHALSRLLPKSGGHVGFHGRDGVWSNAMAERFLAERGALTL